MHANNARLSALSLISEGMLPLSPTLQCKLTQQLSTTVFGQVNPATPICTSDCDSEVSCPGLD